MGLERTFVSCFQEYSGIKTIDRPRLQSFAQKAVDEEDLGCSPDVSQASPDDVRRRDMQRKMAIQVSTRKNSLYHEMPTKKS